jgi:predicted DNA-binding transcriptional regulator AlpA
MTVLTHPTENRGLTLLREREVAEMLAVNGRAVRRMRERGQLPRVIIGQHTVRYRLADVEALIERGLESGAAL